VDPDESLGQMPPFLHFLRPRLEKLMSHFKVSDCKNHNNEDVIRVNFSNEPASDNIISRFGYFD
jgi:hypothetical protein